MANTTVDYDDLLSKLNDEKATLMAPVVVYASLIMVTGLVGNVMVCFYYCRKTMVTSNSTFIVVLAIFGLVTCAVSIPIEIIDLRLYYTFHNAGACKVMRFVNHVAAVGLTITLFAIAIDRYRKICSPFKRQLTIKKAKIACCISGVFSLVIAIPSLVFYEPVTVSVENSYNMELFGSDCTTTRKEGYRAYLSLYYGFFVLIFLVVVITLAMVYCLIGRVIFRHEELRVQLQAIPRANSTATAMDLAVAVTVTDASAAISTIETSEETSNKPTQVETDSVVVDNATGTAKYSNGITSSNGVNRRVSNGLRNSVCEVTGRSTRTRRKSVAQVRRKSVATRRRNSVAQATNAVHSKTKKYTIIMFSITLAFVVSYLPYLVLTVWRSFRGGYEDDYMSDGEGVLFNIGIRSYLLTAAVNPILYGFFNTKFRKYFYSTFCPCCIAEPESANYSITSEGH